MTIEKNFTPLRTALRYVLFGFLWILLSDRGLELFTAPGSPAHLWIQTAKGWLFVLISAGLIYFMLKIDIKSLATSEERYRAIFNSSIDAVLLTSPTGDILAVNPAGCRIFERTEEEIKRIGRSGIVDASDPGLAVALEERNRTGKFEGELMFIRRNGEKFPADVSSSVFKDKDGNLRTSMTLRDISGRKRAEKALRESQQHFKIIFDTLSEGVALNEIVYDDRGEMVDYKILEVNEAFYRIADFRNVEPVIGNMASRLYGMDRKVIKYFWENHKNATETQHAEFVSPISGRIYSIATSPFKNDQFVTSFQNITERKLAEQALRENETNLKRSQQTAHVGHWMWDTQKNVVSWSDEMKRIFGLDPETFHGDLNEVISTSIHADDRERVIKMNEDVIQKGTSASAEYRVVWSDGSIRHVWAEPGDALRDENGSVIQLSGIVQDITERKRAEEDLRTSEAELRAIFENSQQAYMLIDPDRRVRKMNHVALEQEQAIYSRAIQPGDSIYDIVEPEKRPWFDQTFEKVLAGEMLQFERSFNPGGLQHWYEYRLSPVRTDNGENLGAFLVTTDITERKQSEAALQASESHYKALVEYFPGIIYSFRPNLGGVYYSSHTSQLLGYSPEQLYAQPMLWHDSIHPDDVQCVDQTILGAQSGDPFQLEYRIRNASGNWVWLDDRSYRHQLNETEIIVEGFAMDITERKQAGEKIREKDMQFRKLSANVPDLIFQFTRRTDGTYHVPVASEGISNIFGCTPEDVADDFAPIARVIYPEDSERVMHDIEFSAKHLTFFTCEFRVQIPGKQGIQWIYSRSTPEKLPDGSVTWYGFNTNITERKQAEMALRQSEESLVEAQRMAHIGSWEWDMLANRVTWSKEMYRVFDVEPETFDGKPEFLLSLVLPDDVEKITNSINDNLEDGSSPTLEYRVVHKDGSIHHVIADGKTKFDEVGKPIKSIGTVQDITERKMTDEALSESEERHRTLVTSVPIVIFVTNEKGIFTLSEGKGLAKLGLQPGQVVGLSVFDVYRDYPSILIAMKNALAGQSQRYEVTVQGIVFDTLFSPVFDQHGKVMKVIGVANDITENKQAEEARRVSALRFRAISENSLAGIYIVQNGKLSYVNAALADIFKYDPEELLGADPMMLIHPDDRALVSENIRRRIAGEVELLRYEFRGLCKDGEIKHIEVLGARVDLEGQPAIIGNIVDITERKQAEGLIRQYTHELEKRVQERTAEVQDLYNNAPAGYHSLNAQGVIVQINQTELDWLGYTREELVGVKSFAELFTGESKIIFAEQFPILKKRGWVKDLEFDVIRKDGSILPILVNATAIYDESGNFIMTRTSLFDITQRKQAELELQAANIALEKASKLKDEFLANMSHELRTPLNGILGFSETLLEGVRGPLSERQKQAVQTIRASGEHLLGLINDILDVSRIEFGNFELRPTHFDVNEICQSSLIFIKQLAEKKSIAVEYEPPAASSTIFADPMRLKQVLVNLLNNAVKFTPQHGKVKLEVQTDAREGLMRFSVTDTGIGIDPEDLKKLFQPFVQVDSSLSRQYEGSGLGLVLVKKMVSMHGGSMDVQSKAGAGSCFGFSLPWHPKREDERSLHDDQAEYAAQEKTVPTIHTKILLVEDSESNIMLTRDYLENCGHQVFEARHGGEALKKAEEVSPDLILMDVQMPEMDGLEATRRLRANPRFASVPIIAVTAFAMSGDRERCLAAGMNEYISKPFKLKEVSDLIERFLKPLSQNKQQRAEMDQTPGAHG